MDKINIMMDIETLGVTSRAAVMQIGAVAFNNETGHIQDQFLANIDIEDSLKHGFIKESATEKWWERQDPTVKAGLITNAYPLVEVMNSFKNDFIQKNVVYKTTPIWSHATFDFPMVQNYLRAAALPMLNYKMAYDIRTLVGLSDLDLNSYDWSNKTHNALDDCHFQIGYCIDAMNKLKGMTGGEVRRVGLP